MKSTRGVFVGTPIELTLEEDAPITFSAFRDHMCELKVGNRACMIYLERNHVYALRDQLPDVLAIVDQATTAEATCQTAEITSKRAIDAADAADERATTAERAGHAELALAARNAAEWARASAEVVDEAVQTVRGALAAADRAADVATDAATALARLTDNRGDAPAAATLGGAVDSP